MIQNDSRYNNKHYRLLRSIKPKNKGNRSIFKCLVTPIDLPKAVPIIQEIVIKKKNRAERRMDFLLRQVERNKITDKQVKRYVRLAGELSLDVPESVLNRYRELKYNVEVKQKTKRKGNKKKKTTRVPVKYKLYIVSKHWENRKNLYYQSHKRICQACNSSSNIAVHHMFYGNYGQEKDEHLVALCRDCHEEFHTIYGVKKNMINFTNEFIEEKRQSIELKGLIENKV